MDSVSAGLDRTIFFTATGFVPMFLYDLGRNPDIPPEIPYSAFVVVVVEPPNEQAEVEGYVEYRTPKNVDRPRRPKPIERFILGKALYEALIAEADEFARSGPPETMRYEFGFSGKDAQTYASFLAAKLEEYAVHGHPLPSA